MRPLTEQEGTWVDGLAGRLRLIQTDAAALPPEQRQEYLREEVERCLKETPPASRRHLLESLLARFPVAGRAAATAPAETPASAPPPPAPPEPVAETPEQLAQRLIATAASLPDAQRLELSRQLYQAGLGWVDREALVLEISEQLQRKLGLDPNQQPNLARLVELTCFLTDAFTALDQNALKTMRELAPRSALLRRGQEFRKAVSQFLMGEKVSVDAEWQATRTLLGGLFAALQGAGKDFGRQFVERLSPPAIEDVIVGEGGKLFGPNRKERCWDRYSALFGEYATPDLIDRRIKDCLAAFVERTAGGGR